MLSNRQGALGQWNCLAIATRLVELSHLLLELVRQGKVLVSGCSDSPLKLILPRLTRFKGFGKNSVGTRYGQGNHNLGISTPGPIIIFSKRRLIWADQNEVSIKILAGEFDGKHFTSRALKGLSAVVAAIVKLIRVLV